MARNVDNLSPQQEKFLADYLNPKSVTFGNAYQTAIACGFEDSYARNIMNLRPDWLSDRIDRQDLLTSAERVFKKTLNLDTAPKGHEDAQLLRIQNDTAKFIGETVGKNIFSKKSDIEINLNSLPSLIQIVAPVRSPDPIKDITGTIKDVDGLVEPLK